MVTNKIDVDRIEYALRELMRGDNDRAVEQALDSFLALLRNIDISASGEHFNINAPSDVLPLLKALDGKDVKDAKTGKSLISFGSGNEIDRITIGDVAGRDIIKLILVIQTADQAYNVQGIDNPYLGLDAFTYEHRTKYAGRKHEIEEALRLLTTPNRVQPLLFINGASGSGKSSFVQAGLVPALEKYYTELGYSFGHAVIRPKHEPLLELARALAELGIPSEGPFKAVQLFAATAIRKQTTSDINVLVLDQFEECFSTECDNAQRDQLFTLLTQLPSLAQLRLHCIITIRSDFLPDLSQYSILHEIVKQRKNLSAMKQKELEEAIERPLEALKQKESKYSEKHFEPGLVKKLAEDAMSAKDVVGDDAYLPLLQLTLDDLWQRGELRLTAYSSNTLINIASQRANAVADYVDYDAGCKQSRSIEDSKAIINLFIDLVDVSLGNNVRRDVRRRRTRAALEGTNQQQSQRRHQKSQRSLLIDDLCNARLLSSTSESENGREVEVIDIIHESLITNWDRLKQAIRERRPSLQQQARFEQAVRDWVTHERSDDYLLPDIQLTQAEELAKQENIALRDLDAQELLRRTIAAREAEKQRKLEQVQILLEEQRQRAEAEQQRAEEQQKRAEAERLRAEERQASAQRLRRALYVVSVLLVIALVSFYQAQVQKGVARNQASIAEERRQEAEQQKRLAEQQSRIAKTRELAASTLSNLNSDPQLSLLLATAALSSTQSFSEPIVPEAQEALQQAVQASRVQRILMGHSAGVQSVAYNPDGKRIAGAGNDGAIILWDATTGVELRRMTAGGAVNSLDWSPDGKQIATAGEDGIANIWTADNGKSRLRLDHKSAINTVAWSPDGSSLATTTVSGTLTIWNASSGTSQQQIIYDDELTGVAWSPDGTRIAAGSSDGSLHVWDAATSGDILTISDTGGKVDGIAWSPDGEQIAVANDSLDVTVWDVSNSKRVHILKGHTSSIYGVAWSPDGSMLASASADGTAKLWNFTDEREILTLYGHSDAVTDVQFSPDGSALLTASLDRTVRVWYLRFAPPDGTVGVAWSPDGKLLATSGSGGANVWDSTSGRVQRVIDDAGDVAALSFSPNDVLLATGNRDGVAKVYNLANNAEPIVLKGHDEAIGRIAWSPDGQRLATASDDTTVRVWDSATGDEQRVLRGHAKELQALAWSPDGKRLASAGFDGRALLWDVASGTQTRTLSDTIKAEFTAVAWSPKGSVLALADENGTVTLLDSATGRTLHTLRHGANVNDLAFSPDGTRIATAGRNGRVRVWNAATGDPLFVMPHPTEVYSLAFSPDGSRIVTTSADGVARVFPLDLEALRLLAQERTIRPLTADECRQYQLDGQCQSRP